MTDLKGSCASGNPPNDQPNGRRGRAEGSSDTRRVALSTHGQEARETEGRGRQPLGRETAASQHPSTSLTVFL